jgi:hypothetical protein
MLTLENLSLTTEQIMLTLENLSLTTEQIIQGMLPMVLDKETVCTGLFDENKNETTIQRVLSHLKDQTWRFVGDKIYGVIPKQITVKAKYNANNHTLTFSLIRGMVSSIHVKDINYRVVLHSNSILTPLSVDGTFEFGSLTNLNTIAEFLRTASIHSLEKEPYLTEEQKKSFIDLDKLYSIHLQLPKARPDLEGKEIDVLFHTWNIWMFSHDGIMINLNKPFV